MLVETPWCTLRRCFARTLIESRVKPRKGAYVPSTTVGRPQFAVSHVALLLYVHRHNARSRKHFRDVPPRIDSHRSQALDESSSQHCTLRPRHPENIICYASDCPRRVVITIANGERLISVDLYNLALSTCHTVQSLPRGPCILPPCSARGRRGRQRLPTP